MPIFFSEITSINDTDLFLVSLVAGRTYFFDLEGSPTGQGTLEDGRLDLFSPGGSLVASDDNGGVGANARIVFTATVSGQFLLEADGVGLKTGIYRLSVFEDDFRNTLEGVGPSGAIVTADGRAGQINYSGDADVFQVTLIAGLNYTIEQRGAASDNGTLDDAHLFLRNASGQVLASDDDGGIGSNATIFHKAVSTGTHFLEARGDAGTGSYRLQISEGRGSSVADTIVGSADRDAINGFVGNDSIRGLASADTLTGGQGVDTLIGGIDFDIFRFIGIQDSNASARDTITSGDGAVAFEGAGVVPGDLVDLSAIDADAGIAGNQAFVFGGQGAGHLTLSNLVRATLVRGNIDGDAEFEFELLIADGSVTASTYLASDFLL